MLLIHTTSQPQRGLTLVEVLVAMVMTVIVLGAMMSAFSYGSNEMQKGRATIELNNRLVNAEEQLRRDLDRITVELKPYQQLSGQPSGYVEIIDGPGVDATTTVFGDQDDYIAFTIRSDGKPFRGRLGTMVIESHLAEVIWFAADDPTTADNTDRVLVRRQLLIQPNLPAAAANLATDDISVRQEGGTLVANSLSDLAERGNRFAHTNPGSTSPATSQLNTANLLFGPEHVISSSVAAFDIQVFEPDASGYVDLGRGGVGVLGGPTDPRATPAYTELVYDTGTSFYNRNGANNRGANGVDDGGVAGVVDDIGEQFAIAPYNVPIRGLRFTMRVFEPITKQVRQLSVRKSFVPES